MTARRTHLLHSQLCDELAIYRWGLFAVDGIKYAETVSEAQLLTVSDNYFMKRLGCAQLQYLETLLEWILHEFDPATCHPDSRHDDRQALRNYFASCDATLINEADHARLLIRANQLLAGDSAKLRENRVKGGEASRKGPKDRHMKVQKRFEELTAAGQVHKAAIADLMDEFGLSNRQIYRDLKKSTDNA